MDYAIIGGTGIYESDLLKNSTEQVIKTPYGSVNLSVGNYKGHEIAFLTRHGKKHSVTPHKINYRANIWALKSLGVKYTIATAAVGSTNPSMQTSDIVIVDQFLDFTKNRVYTFFDGEGDTVVHIDVTEPYCPELRQLIITNAQDYQLKVHPTGCYGCFEGPRYETAAEVKMVAMLGGDVVGMTSVPEVVLAREAGICYATICMVTNMGAGISEVNLVHDEVSQIMSENLSTVLDLALETLANITPDFGCNCQDNGVTLPGMQGGTNV